MTNKVKLFAFLLLFGSLQIAGMQTMRTIGNNLKKLRKHPGVATVGRCTQVFLGLESIKYGSVATGAGSVFMLVNATEDHKVNLLTQAKIAAILVAPGIFGIGLGGYNTFRGLTGLWRILKSA